MALYVKDNRHFERSSDGAGDDRTVLSADLVEVERSRDHFPYNYLPTAAQPLLREAFACYTADLFLAFTLLCRYAFATLAEQEPHGASFERLFEDAAEISGIDAGMRTALRAALFGPDPLPAITADQAAILIELVRDMCLQRYVRTAKHRRAIRMRRFFAQDNRLTVDS